MVAVEFFEYLSRLQVATYVGVEDLADKCNFLYTVLVLILCTIIITVKLYLFKPLACYISNTMAGVNLQEYVDHYCWVCGTFPIGFKDAIPETYSSWNPIEGQKVLYYQWVPFLLGLQGILFYLPRVIWQVFCYNHAGADLQQIILNATQALHSDMISRKKIVTQISHALAKSIFRQRIPIPRRRSKRALIYRLYRVFTTAFCRCELYGIRLVSGYFLVKFLYILNNIVQLSVIANFLAKVTLPPLEAMEPEVGTFSGGEVLSNLLHGKEWQHTRLFPRVTLCYVPVHLVGSVQVVLAQCVMPINMFNEKIYIFLWFWFSVVLAINITSVPLWMYRIFHTAVSPNFVKKFLSISLSVTPLDSEERMYMDLFLRQYVGPDGLFMLHVINANVGDALTAEITVELWCIFLKKFHLNSHLAQYLVPLAAQTYDYPHPVHNNNNNHVLGAYVNPNNSSSKYQRQSLLKYHDPTTTPLLLHVHRQPHNRPRTIPDTIPE